jgi:glycosyltransferase involved in cell wall biosynthesis
MNILLIAFVILSFTWVFSQFGSRLSAQRSLLWWCVFVFVSLAAVYPHAYDGIVQLLGIQVTSNFILGSLVFFCLLQLLEESASQTKNLRLIRELVSSNAAHSFHSAWGAQKKPKALVVLPAFNEEQSLPTLKDRLDQLSQAHPEIGFCFVDDGSRDRTREVLVEIFPGRYCSHATNMGVSAALLTGFKAAKALGADWVIQCDSDGQHPLNEIPRMIQIAESRDLDLLIGSRYLNPDQRTENLKASTSARRAGGRLLAYTLRVLFGAKAISDPTSGFKVYSKRAVGLFSVLMPDEYPEPEVIALASLAGLKIEEASVVMHARVGGESSLSGIKSAQFMVKVLTALLGFRLRTWTLGPIFRDYRGLRL